MALYPQCWDISVFLLYQRLAVPLKVNEAPPQTSAEISVSFIVGRSSVQKQSIIYWLLTTTTITIPYMGIFHDIFS